jgi:hypothetical protein
LEQISTCLEKVKEIAALMKNKEDVNNESNMEMKDKRDKQDGPPFPLAMWRGVTKGVRFRPARECAYLLLFDLTP